MSFFPEPRPAADRGEPEPSAQPVWAAPPEHELPGVVPLELVIGRSASTAVALIGMRAFRSGLAMRLAVRLRGGGLPPPRDLNDEVFDGPYAHTTDAAWQAGRLKWGFELADGRRVTNVDEWTHPGFDSDTQQWPDPGRPVLAGGGGSGDSRSSDRDYWLWPLPPAGSLVVACQWLAQGIELTQRELPVQELLDAAARARPMWPDE